MRSLRAVCLFFLLVFALPAHACPCGCGAVGPLVMWPGESMKLQFGLTKEYINSFILADGEEGENGGAETTDTFQLGIAKSLTDTLSLSLNMASKRDWHSQVGSEWSFVDPSVGARYIVSQVDYDRPWVPQVQLHATYKYALANLRDGEESNRKLEVESLESSEFVPGVDLWFYWGELAFGVGESLEYRRSVEVDHGSESELREFGLGHRTTVGVSYTFIGIGQLLASIEREAKARDTLAGEILDDSDRVQQTLSLTGNLRIGDRKTLSLNGKLIGKLFQNKNTKSSSSFGVSYIQAI